MGLPKGKSVVVAISGEAAQRLAYYESGQGLGVLAPRGWYCFGTYGSGGEAVDVSPEPSDSRKLFSPTWRGFEGLVIEIAHSFADTSGRYSVASVIGRVFPTHMGFVRGVLESDPASANYFPAGPYPTDKLTYKSDEMVEYETPAQTGGLETTYGLRNDTNPIRGVAILFGPAPDLLFLAVRLPDGVADLAPAVVQQVERDVARLR